MQYAHDGSFNNVASWFLVISISRDILLHSYAAITLCQYHRLWLLHFWNKFRHLILPPQRSNLPAFLYITTNKLFFRISKPPANLYSLFFNRFPIGFIFLCRLVHHPTSVVDHVINFLFLLSFCPPTWKNIENSVSIKQARLLPTLNNSHQYQHCPNIMLYFSGWHSFQFSVIAISNILELKRQCLSEIQTLGLLAYSR